MNIGGPALHALLLEMPGLDYRTLLVAGNCEPGEGDMSYLLRAGDPVCRLPELSRSVRPWSNLKALWRLWRLIRRERPAIVHTHTAMAGCVGRLAALVSGTPIIVHTFHGNSLSQYFSPFTADIFRRIEQLLARFTDVLCVVALQQAAELSSKFRIAPLAKFRVVPLGLELDDFFELPLPSRQGPLIVGWFGRMVPVKNVPLLARTIEETQRQGQNVRFVIAGDGPERSALQPVLDRYGDRVKWLGWCQDILPVLAHCHVLLQTSRNEGTPVALIQGMAAARPFVSTAVGGVPEMVSSEIRREDGDGSRWHANGVLVEADPAGLAGALGALARDRDLLVRMGWESRDFAWRQYRKDVLVRNIDALYRELLEKKWKQPLSALGRNS